MHSFEKDKFDVLRNVLKQDYCEIFSAYFINKANSYETMLNTTFVSKYHDEWGTVFDRQVPGAYSLYGDVMMDMLLVNLHSKMEEKTKLKLQPNYSYARLYKKGHVLERHKDRLSCEVSTTLNLGGDPWPIYLEPSGREGMKGLRVDLNPGDMLIYRGMDLEHWREPFQGNECVQVFLHYNDVNNPNAIPYDGRPHLGLPAWFKRNGK